MNDASIQSSLLELSDQLHIDGAVEGSADAAARYRFAQTFGKLTVDDLHRLYAESPTSQARALIVELHRLHGILRRTAQFVERAEAHGIEALLDITSKTLLHNLNAALREEPAVAQRHLAGYRVRRVKYNRYLYSCDPVADTDKAMEAESSSPVANSTGPRKLESRERLRTWKLVPEPGRAGEFWKRSRYKGIAIVRAYDPVEARRLAADKWGDLAAMSLPSPVRGTPWERRSLVRVELLPDDPTYEKFEQPTVVYP